ncbi:MAG: hypothetical protein KatS3mg045_0563 [Bellilinea sp.]|nr:MAG: hypothetical protein KatS3mg045_0563 [Bellilinea sp.]
MADFTRILRAQQVDFMDFFFANPYNLNGINPLFFSVNGKEMEWWI